MTQNPFTLDVALERVHQLVTSVEPTVRDLNRHLRDLLGPCPVGDHSTWVQVSESGDGSVVLQLPALPVSEALRLSSALANIAARVDVTEVARQVPAPQMYELPFMSEFTAVELVSGHVTEAK